MFAIHNRSARVRHANDMFKSYDADYLCPKNTKKRLLPWQTKDVCFMVETGGLRTPRLREYKR